jgi:hypothetical protein
MPRKVISSHEALTLLNKWKSGSTKLFIFSANCGLSCGFAGFVTHVAESALHFEIEGISVKDFNFWVNCHSASFSLVELEEESSLIFAPGRNARDLGTVLAVDLPGDEPGEIEARVVLSELFSAKFIDIKPGS